MSDSVSHLTTTPRYLPDLDLDGLNAWIASRPESWATPYRAKQILRHYFQRLTADYSEMTDLPVGLREVLRTELPLDPLQVVVAQDDKMGSTKLAIKPLAQTDPRRSGIIECVVMRDENRHSRTICVSSQVGCAMGCQFCASGLDGVVRSLTAGEIIGQVWHAARLVAGEGPMARSEHDAHCETRGSTFKPPAGEPVITNIVFMGVGEPLANVENVRLALTALTSPWGFGLSARRITVSTVGILAGIDKLGELGIPVNLALSLHAADDETRARIIPVSTKLLRGSATEAERAAGPTVEVDRLLDAGDRYFQRTGREVTIEFILLPEVNGHQAEALARLISRHKAGRYNVNVIPYNRVVEFPWREPSPEETKTFLNRLRDLGVNAHARKRMGYGIDGACGQLRLKRL